MRRFIESWPGYRQLRPRTANADRGGEVRLPLLRGRVRPERLRQGRAVVHLEGDPDSPVSRGRLCPKGSASLRLTTGASRRDKAGAQLTGRPELARGCKTGAAVAISGSLFALVHDLGRPERFLNMLRTAKPTSPMSIGSWLLTAYAPAVGAAALSDLTGRLPRTGRLAALGSAVVGPAVAAYTRAAGGRHGDADVARRPSGAAVRVRRLRGRRPPVGSGC